ncbi:MAG: MAPEG family protein [Pseudomonadales bacterium]
MTHDLWALLAVLGLGIVHLGLSSVLSLVQLGPGYILSARDVAREPTGVPGRVARSYRNLLESLPQFVGALLLVHASGSAGELAGIGAWMFFFGRLIYVPAYAFAGPGVRPVCWMVAQIGVIVIVVDLFIT